MTPSPGGLPVILQSFNLQSGALISNEIQQRDTASPAQPKRECHILRAQVLHTRCYTRTHTLRHLYFILFQSEHQHLACADKCLSAAAGRLHSWGRFLPAVPTLHHHHYLWRWQWQMALELSYFPQGLCPSWRNTQFSPHVADWGWHQSGFSSYIM